MNAGLLLLYLLFHLFAVCSIIPLKRLHFHQFLSPSLPQCWSGSSHQQKKELAQDITPPALWGNWSSFIVPTFSARILGSAEFVRSLQVMRVYDMFQSLRATKSIPLL